jgi:O-antigen ligase
LAGDTIWRVGGHRVYSLAQLDDAVRKAPVGVPLTVSVISQGEHVERPGLLLTAAQQEASSPAGVTGSERNHRFRASGWTRHYETFSELLQIIALLALGLALAHLRNHGANKYFRIALTAAALLTLGLVFTAMRTVIVAFVIGACVIAWRSLRGAYKVVFTFALFFVLAFGAVVVWQTRARDALLLNDPSSRLRYEVARVGLSRIPLHPVFGHGMDAMKRHWSEWGFPGKDLLHLHSTPLQLAFDRGLPMLVLWLWMMILFWTHISAAARRASDLSDTHVYGILLGGLGGLTGFLASSLVNYNYGDSEVAMLFWWLMGVCVFCGALVRSEA